MNLNLKKVKLAFKDYLSSFLYKDYFSVSTQNLILILILLIILFIRLYDINTPPLDRTAWKEIDYITISKNYLANGFNLFKPTITWPAVPPRVTAMEFPLVPYLASFLYYFFGFNVYTVRLITLIAFLSVIILEFKLVKKELGQFPALLAALISGILPLNSFFNKFLFSEPTLIACSLFAIYYFVKWIDSGKKRYIILATVGFTLAILLKLTPLYLSIIFLGLYFYKYRVDYPRYKKLILFGFVSILLPIAWYSYAYYLTFHSIDVFGIFKGHDKFQIFGMLSSRKWYLYMGNSLLNLSGGKLGALLIVAGLISLLIVKRGLLFFLYLAAILSYFVIVAEGNIDGPYRQLEAIPVLSCFMAIGALSLMYPLSLLTNFSKKSQAVIYLSLGMMLVLAIQIKHLNFKTFYSTNPAHPLEWKLAPIIKKFSNEHSKLITLGAYSINKGGNDVSPIIYYYSGIQGWTLQKNDWNEATVKKLTNEGADLLVGFNLSREPGLQAFVDELKKIYPVLYENKEESSIILSLKRGEAISN